MLPYISLDVMLPYLSCLPTVFLVVLFNGVLVMSHRAMLRAQHFLNLFIHPTPGREATSVVGRIDGSSTLQDIMQWLQDNGFGAGKGALEGLTAAELLAMPATSLTERLPVLGGAIHAALHGMPLLCSGHATHNMDAQHGQGTQALHFLLEQHTHTNAGRPIGSSLLQPHMPVSCPNSTHRVFHISPP